MKNYVVISFNEDGDPPSIEQMDGDTLKDRLKEKYWGDRPRFAEPGKEIETASFTGIVVIEGKIIEPKAVQVAVEYDL